MKTTRGEKSSSFSSSVSSVSSVSRVSPGPLPSVARVLIDLSLDRPFDYLIPETLRGKIQTGMRVRVPFGKGGGERSACVVSVLHHSEYDSSLKPLLGICETHPHIPGPLIRLAEWMSEYYCCTREQAVRNLLPGAVRNGKIRPKTHSCYFIADAAKASEYIASASGQRKKRAEVLKLLLRKPGLEAERLEAESGAGQGVIRALRKEGLLIREETVRERDPFQGAEIQPTSPLPPTPDQARALDQIFRMLDHPSEQSVLLLHGVTCSGKTEVYLQAIGHVLESGGDAIVLVPEISLTPQTVTRFKARFGDRVSVLHSGLSDGERHDEWMKVHSGRVRIAVGARSALFAPFRNLKLIVVDEEHENSYKQSEAPRYNARDVAVMRGKLEGALVILGSATPSLESYRNAETGRYALAKMLKRSDPEIVMPEVKIIDMRMEAADGEKIPFLSRMLVEAVRDRIRKGEQSILFLNKRGYARQMICELCGYVAVCPECSVPYTYHKKSQLLTCHLCAGSLPAPQLCPGCASEQIRYQGAGTERIEIIAGEVFKGARIARMDSDTMTRPSLYEKVLSSFRRGETDILIGTQMIAKGLDFPNVTLVGIINADMGLYIPDFRAQERSFQLIAQVAGRAGRGFVRGEVLVQTSNPFNPAIQCAAEHDYAAFYQEEMPIRKELNYPPCGHLIALHFDGTDPETVLRAAIEFRERARPFENEPSLLISDPAPAPLERIRGKYRFMMIVRGEKLGAFRKMLRSEIMAWRRKNKQVDFYADVDALNLM